MWDKRVEKAWNLYVVLQASLLVLLLSTDILLGYYIVNYLAK